MADNFSELTWSVIDTYFRDNAYFIVKHHLDSYNDFVFSRIPYTIRSLNPFRIVKTDSANDKVENEIKVYMGGLDGNRIYMDKPVYVDGDQPRVLFPNEARLRNLSYVSHIYVDVEVHYHVTSEGASEPTTTIKTFDRVYIGAIPIMLHSRLCSLFGLSERELIEMGECPYDQGGYFIMDGKEKVIIPQERGATNKLFVNRSTKPEYTYESYIRCMSEEDSLFPKTMELFMMSNDVASGRRRNAIVVTVPHIGTKVPLFVLFRALGVESDRDIIDHIIPRGHTGSELISLLYHSVVDCPGIYTQEHALEYLKGFTEYKTVDHVRYILMFNVLPNVGHEFRSKALFLGHIVHKMLNTSLGVVQETDRDNYMYKRVHLSGLMLSDIFRDFYNGLRRHVRGRIDREYEKGPWRKAGNIQDMVNAVNKDTIFSPEFVAEGMMKSMKGNWGLMDDPTKQGIVQDLARISYVGFVSHLRRVNTPIDRSIKIVSPHRLNTSQYGVMCPVESPDGASIGLIKNIAMLANITYEVSPHAVLDALTALGDGYLSWLDDLGAHDIIHNTVKLFVNNCWVGVVNRPEVVVRYLRLLRRNALISVFTSVSWNIRTNDISVLTEAGRCCRPLYIVHPDRTLPVEQGEWMSGRRRWHELFEGTLGTGRFHNMDFIDPFKLTSATNVDDLLEILERSSAVMEYVDVEESNTCMIAMRRKDVEHNANVPYTHLELHPTTMFSMYTATIPLADHNQAPRNIFSGAQGKQAVGVYATNFNNRLDTMSYVLHYPQKPLVSTRYMELFHCNKLPFGENLIVAIACYSGFNQEDSIIINKASMQRGMFNMTYLKTVVDAESNSRGQKIIFTHPLALANAGKQCRINGLANYHKIDTQTGLPVINSVIKEGDVYLGKCKVTVQEVKGKEQGDAIEQVRSQDTYEDKSLKGDKTVSGMIDKVFVSRGKGDDKHVKIRFRKVRTPELGDKCASRHGQKGVVGMMFPPEDMPFTREGLVPDMIINPHAIPSRMTVGHLIECVISKVCCLDGFQYDATPFEDHDIEAMYDRLEQHGFERNGNEMMYNGQTGEQMETEVFIGPTYYMRLKHMVADKINYRLEGPVTNITRQPTKGRANDGGLRIGNMETDVLMSHGMFGFLKESMMERSDGTVFDVDADAGCIVGADDDKAVYAGAKHLKRIAAPYALKAFMYEMNTMAINPVLVMDEHTVEKNKEVVDAFDDYEAAMEIADEAS